MRTKKLLPGLLALAGGVSALLATYFAIKESPEAYNAVDEEAKRREEAKEEPMTKQDEIVTMAPHYKKTAIAAGASVVFITGSYISGAIAIGTLGAAAYAWQKKYLDAEKILDSLSPELRKKLHLEEAAEKVKTIVETGKLPKEPKKKLFEKKSDENMYRVYDALSDQSFWTSDTKMLVARDMLYQRLAAGRKVRYNNIIRALGGKADSKCENIGWSMYSKYQEDEFSASNSGYYVQISLIEDGRDHLINNDLPLLYFSVPPVNVEDVYDPAY